MSGMYSNSSFRYPKVGVPSDPKAPAPSPNVGVQSGTYSNASFSYPGPKPTPSLFARMRNFAAPVGGSLQQPAHSEPASVPAPVAASAASAKPTAVANGELPEWAKKQVELGKGNPQDFAINDEGMLEKRVPAHMAAAMAASRPAGPTVAAAPAARPTPIGVPGMPSQIGYKPNANDPIRSALMDQFNEAAWRAQGEGAFHIIDHDDGSSHRDYSRPALGNMMALASAIGQHDSNSAALATNDPNRQVNMLRQIAADPQLRAFWLASKGADPAAIAQVPNAPRPGEPAVNDSNYMRQLQSNPTLGTALGDDKTSLLDKLRQVQNQPGIADLNHPNHQALQAFVNQKYSNPRDWEEETYIPPDPSSFGVPQWLMRPLGVGAAITQALTGVGGSHSAGTGFGWPQNFQDRTAQADLLRRFGIRNPADIPKAVVNGQAATGY